MDKQTQNHKIASRRFTRQQQKFTRWICSVSIIIGLLGCSFGIYGIRLAAEANKTLCQEQQETDINSFDEMDSSVDNNWSIFHEVGLHYDDLYPLDIECQATFFEEGGGGRVHVVMMISRYGDKWKEEMERYVDLLTTELEENGVIWEVGFEQIEVRRGGLGWHVTEAQEAWAIYYNKNSDFDDFIRYQINHGGTVMSNYRAGYSYDAYRTRALYLQSLYEFLTKY